MKLRLVARVLALLSAMISIFMFWPLFWAFLDGTPDVKAFSVSIAIGFLIAAFLYILGRQDSFQDIGIREAFAVVTLSWVTASIIGGLPYLLNGTAATFTDAFFEAMSGFTTTGASILTNIEAEPRGILFWRDLTHWLGGMGIIVLSLAILPFIGVGGMELYKAEVPGPIPEKMTPRIQQTALLLWGVYIFLSALQSILLLFGGMNLFDALTHTFGTMATAGFSPKNASVAHYGSAYIDWVITIFMFLAGSNFALHYHFLQGKWDAWWKDGEFRVYFSITTCCTFIITILLLRKGIYSNIFEALRYAAFQVVSIITTTGFVTADYELWPIFTQFLLLILMFIGGCAGSTGGGIKNLRIMVLVRHAYTELYRLLHPKAIIHTKIGDRTLSKEIVGSITAFFLLYIGLFTLATLLMTGLGLDLVSAISSVAATLGNIGPGLAIVGPTKNYALIPDIGKWILSFCMLLGRLELYTVLILCVPATWRR